MRKIGKNFSFLIHVITFALILVFMAGCASLKMAKFEEEMKANCYRIEEAYNKGNLDVYDEFYATDCVFHAPHREYKGLEEHKKFMEKDRTAYPDMESTIDEIIVGRDTVVVRNTWRGTQTGVSPTFKVATGKEVTFKGCSVSHIKDGKVVEEWGYFDLLGFIRQLGFEIVPPKE